jgi:hypothetical protein
VDADDVDALAVQLRIHALVAEYQSSQGRWQTAQGVALGAGAFAVVG